ncbi:SMP-30/gluconolactonase/LRE family protein [Lysobacter auxotrophicus]|uniref:SMP-30/gluconolactonase/LRE family protein n=1 Tax=Lysobacter auxotrophicus TaxID=2992573 RepID=A0ABM8DDR9_9GAMM|nr:SMP-30/gluconolactonase/LRE family protein [Lysobacter auxotrophicus]BDU16719.1 SMP-30/gluconolactonase/LRE family protein [Lysobacter auxotrophicus]
MSIEVRVAVQAENRLGEGVLWCDRAQALYWTDIHAAMLWRYVPADGAVRSWPMPERLASFALCVADDWLLLALATRFAFFNIATGELRDICTLPIAPQTRANDGACDRHGRFVVGTLHEPSTGGKRAIGTFLRLDADLAVRELPLPRVAIANAIAFSPDGSTMYFCDSLQKKILRCEYGDEVGNVSTFVDLTALEGGEPDGSCVDREGGVWNAQWGASRVVRYRADGIEDRVVAMPTAQPTRPAFGGPTLSTLYVTSAHDGMADAARSIDRHAGDVFAFEPGLAGLREPRFAGDPDAAPRR